MRIPQATQTISEMSLKIWFWFKVIISDMYYSYPESLKKTIYFYFQAGRTGQIGVLAVKVVMEVNRNVAENAY